MPFHRLVAPTYFGGLPGTHDYINDPSANGDPGAPAPADTKKSVGVNEGTYFVAFGEPATSSNVNRISSALAQNTDFLDDIVHADQSIPTVSAGVTPGAPVSSVVITGNVFVGAGGSVNDQRTRSGLVAVLDGDGIPLHVLSGSTYVPVLVSLIHDGVSNNVVGNEYHTNPTVDFSPSIPTGQTYRLVHYIRGSLKTQPAGTYTRLSDGVRGAEDLWAFAKTTRLGDVTLTGDKIFQGTATFENDVFCEARLVRTAADPEDVWLDSDTPEDVLTIAGRFRHRIFNVVDSYLRAYHGHHDGDETGLFFTSNARWNATDEWWEPDEPNNAGATALVLHTGGLRVLGMSSPPPANWGGTSANPWINSISLDTTLGRLSGLSRISSLEFRATDGSSPGDFTYSPTPTRTLIIPLELGQSAQASDGTPNFYFGSFFGNGVVWASRVDDGRLYFPLNKIIPNGALLTQVRVLLREGDATGQMRVSLYLKQRDFAAPSLGDPVETDFAQSTGAGVTQVVTLGSLAILFDPAANERVLRIQASSNGASVADWVAAVEVTFADPGPRNF